MHLQSIVGFLAPLITFLQTAAADNSTSFKLTSHVLHPPNQIFEGLYVSSFSFHPGGFYYATLAAPSDENVPLVSFLTGTSAQLKNGDGALESLDVQGQNGYPAYWNISAGIPGFEPSAYDYVGLTPGDAETFGLHFDNGVLKYKGVHGNYYACTTAEPTPVGELPIPPNVYQLFYKPVNNKTPANCSTLQLLRVSA